MKPQTINYSAPMKEVKPIKLYHHETSGGAKYLFNTFIKCPTGHKEGCINAKTKYIIRLDGITPELTIRGQ